LEPRLSRVEVSVDLGGLRAGQNGQDVAGMDYVSKRNVDLSDFAGYERRHLLGLLLIGLDRAGHAHEIASGPLYRSCDFDAGSVKHFRGKRDFIQSLL
jgi:hypothetical protein